MAELRQREEGKQLCGGVVVDNSNDYGKHQVCRSFIECESMYSKIALCGS